MICPSNAKFPAPFEVIDDIAIYRHPLPPEGRGAGVYAPTLDPSGLAETCQRLMQEDSLRVRCRQEAAKLCAETFVWENEAKKYVDAYERTLAQA